MSLIRQCKLPVRQCTQCISLTFFFNVQSNYQQRQWDVGSFMLYDAKENSKALKVVSPQYPTNDDVGSCLMQTHKNKESHLGCMDYFLGRNYNLSDSVKFWKYQKADPLDPPDHVDACIVFSGPAKNTDNSTTTLEFQKCSHDYTDSVRIKIYLILCTDTHTHTHTTPKTGLHDPAHGMNILTLHNSKNRVA